MKLKFERCFEGMKNGKKYCMQIFLGFFLTLFLQCVMSKTCTCIFKSLPNKRRQLTDASKYFILYNMHFHRLGLILY